jgi:hypothetical protein
MRLVASVGDVVAAVRAALAQVAAGRAAVVTALALIEQAGYSYAQLGEGSSRPDMVVASTCLWAAHIQCQEVVTIIDQVTDHANSYLALIAGPALSADGSSPDPAVRSGPGPGVRNRHGDRYPEEAAPYVDSLPPRVIKGQRNAEMTGYVVIDGREYGRITATTLDSWTEVVTKRLRRLGMAGFAGYLSNHVEMKVVQMMVDAGTRSATVTINHRPCGTPFDRRPGCHDVLGAFLPRGSSLTVLGTDAAGQPFRHVYHGEADR